MSARVPADALPQAAYALALASLPGAGPVGLARLLSVASPAEAWRRVLAGEEHRPPAARGPGQARVPWDVAAARFDVEAHWTRAHRASIEVTWIGDARYPEALVGDPLPPAVLFWRGDLAGTLGLPCVAVVGTRRATPEGRSLACELGRGLAEAGVCVASGLALGIDRAAHLGALNSGLAGATLGVAASGVDHVYPPSQADVWEAVAGVGAVLSETPPGHPAQRWRFPVRNRIIAGLASMVVVVESYESGGALLTAEAALDRGVEVRAVPGPVRSPASAGTIQLLIDGAAPVRDAADILGALSLPPAGSLQKSPRAGRARPDRTTRRSDGPAPDRFAKDVTLGPEAVIVLESVGWALTSLGAVVERSGLGVATVARALDRLAADGLVVEDRGWWQRHG